MDYAAKSLELHAEWQGKIEMVSRVPVETREDLSLAYTPGVAQPCLAIEQDISQSYALTRRANLVAVITDGTAVLGLGDIGPEAAMPVMEGKAVLFKAFGDVDAVPLCVRSKDVDEFVNTVRLLAGSFGGINLEDISAPRCFEIERKLKACCDIPIFHDDQHGTAIVVLAAMFNAMRLTGKRREDITVVINGAGSAGIAVARLLLHCGMANIILCDREGIVHENSGGEKALLAAITNPKKVCGSLAGAMRSADVFIGLSAPNCVSQDMVQSMNRDPILFALSNPVPEIMPDLARAAGAAVIGTGRSDFPNQINNVLAFPGVFRGALDVFASDINEEMKLAAAHAIAQHVRDDQLCAEYIIPSALDKTVAAAVAQAVAEAAVASGVARRAAWFGAD